MLAQPSFALLAVVAVLSFASFGAATANSAGSGAKPLGIVTAENGKIYESIRAAMADPTTCGQKLMLEGVFIDPFDTHADKEYACDSLWLECDGKSGKPCATIVGGDWAFSCTASLTMRNILFDGAFVHDLAFLAVDEADTLVMEDLHFRNYLRPNPHRHAGPKTIEERLAHLEAKVKELVVADIVESQRRAAATTQPEQADEEIFNKKFSEFQRAHPRGWASYKHYVDVVKQPHRAPARLTELDQDVASTDKQATNVEKSSGLTKEKDGGAAADKTPAHAHMPVARALREYPYAAGADAVRDANLKYRRMIVDHMAASLRSLQQSNGVAKETEEKQKHYVGEEGRPIFDLTKGKEEAAEKKHLVGEPGRPIYDLTAGESQMLFLFPEFEPIMPTIQVVSTLKQMFEFLADESDAFYCRTRQIGDIMNMAYLRELPPRMAKKYLSMMECGPDANAEAAARREKRIASILSAQDDAAK